MQKHYEFNSLLRKVLALLKGKRETAQNEETARQEETARAAAKKQVQNIILSLPFMPKTITASSIENSTAFSLGSLTAPPPSENQT